ncbi:MAG: DUF4214 domain-containing protein [Rhodoferax sp.]|nr:DUF4214 domain-containing protein [Rhodoferax sp.]
MSIANLTDAQIFGQLNSGRTWNGSVITYRFPVNTSGLTMGSGRAGEGAAFRPATAAQQTMFMLAVMTWDDLVAPNFTQTGLATSNIEFAYTTTGIDYAHAYYPSGGTVWFNGAEPTLVGIVVGSYGFQVMVHELGHALGLDHMGDYNGEGAWTPSSYQDSVVLSIMSYFGPSAPLRSSEVASADWTGTDGREYGPQTPMLNDIMVIQNMYGASTTTRTGDTVYGFGSNITGNAANIYDFILNPHPILTIFDSAGNDTLNLSGWATPSDIHLESGAFSSANGMTNNIAIAYSAVIENAVGGAGNDTITGNALSNRLDGGGGNDTIDGGNGTDTAVLPDNYSSYTFNYDAIAKLYTVTGASSGTDIFSNIEYFQFADQLLAASQLGVTGGGGDVTAPTLVSVNPADNATDVATSANLVLTFNEPVQAGSGSILIYNSNGTVAHRIAVGDTSQVSISGLTVTINPSSDLAVGNSYYVNLTSGVFKDIAGNAFAGISSSTALNFSTVSVGVAVGDDYPMSVNTTGFVVVDGAATSGVINFVDDGDLFKVNLVKGESYIFRASSSAGKDALPDPYLILYATDGSYLMFGDNTSAGLNAEIIYTASASGVYYLAAYDAGSGIGKYQLTAAHSQDDFPWETNTEGLITVNANATSGVIDPPGDVDLFGVNLEAGISYIFELTRTSGGLNDPYMILYGPDVIELAYDDESGGSGNARIEFTAPSSGTYFLGAMDYDSGMGGYTFSARSGAGTSTSGNDSITGSQGNDVLYGGAGDDTLTGGDGIDTAVFGGLRSVYTINATSTGFLITGPDGTDVLSGIERLQFSDKTLALDIQGNAGQVYRLYQAAFNRTPDNGGLKYWIERMDAGTSLDRMSAEFIGSAEFKSMYGNKPGTAEYVTRLYDNVLHRAPESAGYNWWVNEIDVNHRSPANVLASFADSPENQANLIGVIQNGIELLN